MTEKYEYCSTVPRNFVQDWFGVSAQSKVRLNEFGSPNTFYPSAFNLYFHKYLKNVSVILISDWILSKLFYIKSTDVSICPLRNLYWDTFVRKNENSFNEGTIYVLGHTLQYFGWVYKQAILSDNWDEKEFWISSSSSVSRLCSCVAQFQERNAVYWKLSIKSKFVIFLF